MSGGVWIVVPCYQEALRLELGAFARALERQPSTHLLFVDDGSTDATRSMLEGLEANWPGRVRVLSLPENLGKAGAVRAGVLAAFDADPEYVGYWDADLATPLEELTALLAVLEREPALEIALGSRVQLLGRSIERLALRHYLGRVIATAAAWALGVSVYDTQCGAKLMRASERIRSVFAEPFRTGWAFDVELLARWLHERRQEGAASPEQGMIEVPLQTWRHVPGSKVRPSDMPRALIALWWIRRRYR